MRPNIVIRIEDSYITKDSSGELIETVELLPDGSPDWSAGGVCDERGGGSAAGFRALVAAFHAVEANAASIGVPIRYLSDDNLEVARERLRSL